MSHTGLIYLCSCEQTSHQQTQAVSNILTPGTCASQCFPDEVSAVKAVKAVNIKSDLTGGDAAFEKNMVVFDSILMGLLFQ